MNNFKIKLDPNLKARLINVKNLFEQGFIQPIPYIERREKLSTQVMRVSDEDDDSGEGGGGGGTIKGLRTNTKAQAKARDKIRRLGKK